MLNKVVFLVLDGLGDRPIEELDGLTPLESAKTPNFDKLAAESECGMLWTLGRGFTPGSDVGHLGIFGYAPQDSTLDGLTPAGSDVAILQTLGITPGPLYSGRGPIEAAGIGFEMQNGDIALRGNFGTVDDKGNIRDRRAGRIRNVVPFAEKIDGLEIDDVKFYVKPGTAHRAAVIMRGKDLSSMITDGDPHRENQSILEIKPKDDSPEAARTSKILNKFLRESHEILKKHELNKQRRDKGEFEANYLLVRGAGKYNNVPKFKEFYGLSACCIAGGGLYKGIGSYLGMKSIDVPGATGLPDTDVEAKFNMAKKQINNYDFVFIHVKAADSLGEDGNFVGKKEFIEKIDRAASILMTFPDDILIVVTADHSTPCALKAHSADPVPIIFHGKGVRVDRVTTYGERSCTAGGLGFLRGRHVMPHIINLMGRSVLQGA